MKKWQLSRRTFLRGTGYTIALPFLEAMLLPLRSHAADMPVRFLAIYFGNGVFSDVWYPSGSGTNWQLSGVMQPLSSVKQHIMPIRGLHNDGLQAAYVLDGGIGHWAASSSFLTGQHYDYGLRRSKTALFRAGASLDQLYGQASPTMFKSLVMGSSPEDALGNSDARGFGSFLTHISYRESRRTTDPATAIDQIVDRHASSYAVFQQLFGNGPVVRPPDASNFETIKSKSRLSILHYVNDDIQKVRRVLGAADNISLDQFLTQIEEVERNIAATEGDMPVNTPACTVPSNASDRFSADRNPANGNNLTQRVMNMVDLMVLATKCDLTRSVSFMLENEHSYANLADRRWTFNTTSPEVNYASYAHHDASHYNAEDVTTRKSVMTEFHKWHCSVLAALVSRLSAEQEGGSTLLDNSLVLFGSGLGNSDAHAAQDLPILLAGRAGGALTPGRLLQTNGAKYSNFLLTLARTLGLSIPSIGFSNSTMTL